MTPEEKSKELFDKFYSPIEDFDLEHEVTCISERKLYAKQCALIAVKEMISLWEEHAYPHPHYGSVKEDLQQVKQAIEKL